MTRGTSILRVCLFHVKYFPKNTYFPEMLFSGKENNFKCLVAFQKMLWKIFYSVWLCCWKYHRKHIFYLLLTFSHIFSTAKQIYNFIPQSRNTNKTQKKKKIHNPIKLREEGRERGRSVLGSRTIGFGVRRSRSGMTNQCCDCNRDRHEGEIVIGDDESGLRTIGFGVWRERSVLGCDENDSKGSGLWVRSLSRCDLSGRSLANRRGVLSPSLFFLYLTLT